MTDDNIKWKQYGEWRKKIYPQTEFSEIKEELKLKLFLKPEDEVEIVSILLRPGRVESIRFRLNGVIEEVGYWK